MQSYILIMFAKYHSNASYETNTFKQEMFVKH